MPSHSQKLALQNSQLGKKKVQFCATATAFQVEEKLEEIFPKLKLLKSDDPVTSLSLIVLPAEGYSVNFLCDSFGVGQAMV